MKENLICLVLIFTIISCNGGGVIDDDNDNLTGSNNNVSAVINGELFESYPDNTFGQIDQSGGPILLSISGSNDFNPQTGNIVKIEIHFRHLASNTLEENTYQAESNLCDPDINICPTMEYLNANAELACDLINSEDGNFTVSISSLDYRSGGHIIGEFSGTLECGDESTLTVTEGKFNLTLD